MSNIFLPFFFLLSIPFLPLEKGSKDTTNLHPFYVSVTEINQNVSGKSLEVSCRFFTDDFEATLRSAYKTKLDFTAANEKTTFDRLIPDYVGKRLSLIADGKPLALTYIGFEQEKESVYCYFEVPNATTIKQLQVGNSLLHDFKNEQINILHVTINGKRQSTKLDYPARQASFQFN